MRSIFQPSQLTWRQAFRQFSYYSFGVAALWAVAIALYLIFRPLPH